MNEPTQLDTMLNPEIESLKAAAEHDPATVDQAQQIDLTLKGDAFKAQFGTPERIAMLVQKLEDIANHPQGISIVPKVEALNVMHSPAEMAEALKQIDGHSAYVVIQMMRHIILSERSASEGFYLVQQARLANASEVMGYMSMALEYAQDAILNSNPAKKGVIAALAQYRQWCDGMLKGNGDV